MHALLFALGSNISFAFASFYFTEFSRLIGPVWVNFVKSIVAVICFALVVSLSSKNFEMSPFVLLLFSVSGIVGLLIGDIFLLKAFKELGSGRVLMIFGFQPLMLGITSYFLFNEDYSFRKILALFFLIACLYIFSFESFKEKGHWDIKGLLYAIIGVSLDAIGLLLTKTAFNAAPDVTVFEANLVRSGITVIGFIFIFHFFKNEKGLLQGFRLLNSKQRFLVLFSSALGTFVSLALYMKAVQIGSLPTVAALAGTSPLLATLFEISFGRKKLTIWLTLATLSFLVGIGLLVFL